MIRRDERGLAVNPDQSRRPYLEDAHVGQTVRTHAAAVHLDVLQPLDVRLGVAEHLAHELHVASHHRRAIGWQTSLEDRSVGRALWRAATNHTEAHTNAQMHTGVHTNKQTGMYIHACTRTHNNEDKDKDGPQTWADGQGQTQ